MTHWRLCVCKIPHKLKTHRWNQLKILVGPTDIRGNMALKGLKCKMILIKGKLPFHCFLFGINRSFRSKVMVKNVTSQITIFNVFYCFFFYCLVLFCFLSYGISYVFYCFLKLRCLFFFSFYRCITF